MSPTAKRFEVVPINAGRASREEHSDGESGERLSAAAQVAPGVICSFRFGPDGVLAMPYASEGLRDCFGVAPEEVRLDARPLFERLHPDDRGPTLASLEASGRGMVTWRAEFRVLHPERGLRWIEGQAAPRREADGGTEWHGFLIDASERKIDEADLRASREQLIEALERQQDMERELRDSEERFSNVFRHSPVAKILIRNRDRLVVEVNDAYLTLFGSEREAFVGRHVHEVPQLAFVARRSDLLARVFAGEELKGMEVPFSRGDSAIGHALLSAGHILVGGVDYVLAAVVDITARKAAEEARLATESRFRALAENIREVFWLTEPHTGRVLYVSPAYESLWGRSCESLYQRPLDWADAIHPADRARIVEAMGTKQAAGTYDEEYRIVHSDGTLRWIRDRAFPVRDGAGTVVQVAGVAEDVTERKELEAQLRQSQKMESMGQLAGGVAHDFNNILTIIVSSSRFLLETTQLGGDARQALHDLAEAGDRAVGLTRQLLAFSRREVVEPRELDLGALLCESHKILGRLLGEDIRLETHVEPELPRVKIDPGQWTSVIMNLAVNARDAMPRGGGVSLRVSAHQVDEALARAHPRARPGRYVVLEVSDEGEGIPERIRDRIYEPFFTTKGLGQGTGLGLAVVHGIVEQSGGFILLESEPGLGTTFRLFVPALERPATTEPARPAPTRVSGHETILLVEDEAMIRRVATRGLASRGYHVLAAAGGEEALRILEARDGDIDILITDVVMPGMDGRELAEAVERRHPGLRVLYTSGYTDDAVLRHGISQRDVDFLAKPYEIATLARKLREVLDTDRAHR